MVLGLGDSELPADVTREQQPLGTDDRVEAAERVRVMTVDVAGNALGRTPMLGLELDLLATSAGANRGHDLHSMGPLGSCLGSRSLESNDSSGFRPGR